jgi:hypothetical protein
MTTQGTEGKPRTARVQVGTVRARDAYVEKQYGAGALQRYRGSASPPLRELLGATAKPPGGWVDFALFVEATVLADRLFGRGDMALAWEMGRFAASHNAGVWKSIFMRHVRPAMLLGITSGLWSSHYDGGRLASRSTGDASMLVSILDFPAPHRAHCLSIGGWMQGSLELGPRKNIHVQELSCRLNGGTSCDFRLTWA